MKATRREVVALWNGLNGAAECKGAKFSYAVAKNLRIIRTEMEALQEAAKPPIELQAYERERVALCAQHSVKDEFGAPVIVDGKFTIEDDSKFRSEFELLQAQYKAQFDIAARRAEEMETMLSEEVDLPIHCVPADCLPDNLTAVQVEALFPMIVETAAT